MDPFPANQLLPDFPPFKKCKVSKKTEAITTNDGKQMQCGKPSAHKSKCRARAHKSYPENKFDDSDDDDFKPSGKPQFRPVHTRKFSYGSFTLQINEIAGTKGMQKLLRHLESCPAIAWNLQLFEEEEESAKDSESEQDTEKQTTAARMCSVKGLSVSSEIDFRNGVVWYIPIHHDHSTICQIASIFALSGEKITFSNSTNLVPLLHKFKTVLNVSTISDVLVKLRAAHGFSIHFQEDSSWVERVFKDQRRSGGFARSLATTCSHLAQQYKIKERLRQGACECGVAYTVAVCCLRTLQTWAIHKALAENLHLTKTTVPAINDCIALQSIKLDHSVTVALAEAEANGVRIDVLALRRCTTALRSRFQDLQRGREARLRARHAVAASAANICVTLDCDKAERRQDEESASIGLDLRRFVNPLWNSLVAQDAESTGMVLTTTGQSIDANTADMKLETESLQGWYRNKVWRTFPHAFVDLVAGGTIALSRPPLNRWPRARLIPREERTILVSTLEHAILDKADGCEFLSDPNVFVQPDPLHRDKVHGWGVLMSVPAQAESGEWLVEVGMVHNAPPTDGDFVGASQGCSSFIRVSCRRVHLSRQDSDQADLRAAVVAEEGAELLHCGAAVDLGLWAAATLSRDQALVSALASTETWSGAGGGEERIYAQVADHWIDKTQAVPTSKGPQLARAVLNALVSWGPE